MIGKIKALGLAMLAIGAMSLVAATAAQAAAGEIHVSAGPNAIVTGEQTTQQVFELTEFKQKVLCTQAHFEGTIPSTSSGTTTTLDATLTARYTGCTFAGVNVTIDMNGCKYTITGTAALTAQVDITGCTPGKHITITAFGCEITVPEQNNLSHIVFQNTETVSPKIVHANITIQGITYEFSSGGFTCPGASGILHHDGDETGGATFKGFVDQANTVQEAHNGHQFTRHVVGAQVDIFGT